VLLRGEEGKTVLGNFINNRLSWKNTYFFFSVKHLNHKGLTCSHGNHYHSILRHIIRARFHDRPDHHEDHARLLIEATGLIFA
jgi:hypothetical protein